MAQHFPNVTLSLTLPISCHICLGKVRQPVICVNHHVFCSTCIEMWLKTASQCPACRVPITDVNPCREIIGGTNETEPSESLSLRRKLRRTRGELLLKEYEDDIEGLLKENEDLKSKNQSLESQLRTALDPCTMSVSQREDNKIDLCVLEEWANKLRAATDRYCEVKQEMERLTAANKTLRSQNIDLVQENMRLKSEVASRSPQKFGRYTVAALEAKISQYERDLDHLKRALERSDQYIEDLESRVTDGESKRPSERREAPRSHPQSPSESGGGVEAGTGAGTEACVEKQRIVAMRRSLSDMETASIYTNLEGVSQTLAANGNGFLLATSTGLAAPDRTVFGGMLSRQGDKDAQSSTSVPFLPSTPASAFRCLSLKSPRLRVEKKQDCRPSTFLRRLSFEDCSGNGNAGENKRSHFNKLHRSTSPSCSSRSGLSRPDPSLWGAWPKSSSTQHPPGPSPTEEDPQAPNHREKEDPTGSSGSPDPTEEVQTSSEASMDAAFLDKISELDSMMLDGESSSSRGSQLSLASLRSSDSVDCDATLVTEPSARRNIPYDPDLGGEDGDAVNESCPSSPSDEEEEEEEEEEGVTGVTGVTGVAMKTTPSVVLASSSSTLSRSSVSPGGGEASGLGQAEDADKTSQTDALSFDLLFNPTTENQEGGSGCGTPADLPVHDPPSSSSSSGHPRRPGNTATDRHMVTPSQSTKRKSHSPFNITSPSKLSKYM